MKNLSHWKKTIPVFSQRAQSLFDPLQREIDNAINEFYNMLQPPVSSSVDDVDKLMINPFVDIIEDENTFKVEVEIPGMGEEDVKVAIKDQILSITGKKETSKKDEGKNYISREISYGFYERDILLPDYVDPDKAKASFKKGMLWVSFPKKEGAGKKIREIKVENADKKP